MTQKEALNILKTGANVFLTGAAGSGKTYVLREYLSCLRERNIPVGITASTGIAATHMGGITIHSWSGIGVKDSLSDYDIEEIAEKESTAKKILAAKVLIIDEVSMLHHYRLDMINRVLKHVRNSDLPFGGLQIIVCGDFFQLPPITRASNYYDMDSGNRLFEDEYETRNSEFAYHSRAWKEAQFIVCYLEEQFRQTDPQYSLILNAVRNANVTKDVVDLLKTRFLNSSTKSASGVGTFPLRAINHSAPLRLCGGSTDPLAANDIHTNSIQEQSRDEADTFPRDLAARGDLSRGNVVGEVGENVPVEPTKLYSHNTNVDVENDRELSKLSGRVFEYQMEGHGNKKLVEGLKKSCLSPEKLRLKLGARVMFVKNNYEKGYVNGTLGIVDECSYDSIVVQTKNARIHVEKETWRVEDGGRSLAEIDQYPLRLAWAITIHKSQGMSLDAAHIDLSRSFEKGMGYVALSRVRTLAGLHLLGLNKTALDVHDEALEYDKKFQELSAMHNAEYSIMPEDEIRKLQISFLGPEPTTEEKVLNVKKAKKIKEKKFGGEKVSSIEVTKQLIDDGKGIKDAADARGLVADTILGHIEKIKKENPTWNISSLREEIPKARFDKIAKIFHKVGMQEGGGRPLGPVKGILGGSYSYEEIRLVRLFL